jgi:hypothetical protein
MSLHPEAERPTREPRRRRRSRVLSPTPRCEKQTHPARPSPCRIEEIGIGCELVEIDVPSGNPGELFEPSGDDARLSEE